MESNGAGGRPHRRQHLPADPGAAPKHAGLDRINPGSVILSGVVMLEFLGWQDAADLVTDDLARLMEAQVDPVICSGSAASIIERF